MEHLLRGATQSGLSGNSATGGSFASVVAQGLKGDIAALKEIANRLDGKLTQAIAGDSEHHPSQAAAYPVHRFSDTPEPSGLALSHIDAQRR